MYSVNSFNKILQLQQNSRRTPQTFNSGPPNSNGMSANSPQQSGAPPLNTLSEHAPAQMAATGAKAPMVRSGGIANVASVNTGNSGFNPTLARLHQGAGNSSARAAPPSPPLGNAQKGTMPPPSHPLTPSPLGKDQGKGNTAAMVCNCCWLRITICCLNFLSFSGCICRRSWTVEWQSCSIFDA